MVEQCNGIETITNTEEITIGQSEDQLNLNVSCSNNNIKPYSTTSSKRNVFIKMSQMKGESFEDFYSRLQSQSKMCEFEARDRLLIYNIILGITSDQVRKELMSDADLSLGKTIEMCRKSEQPWRKLKSNDVENTNNKKRKYQNEFTAPSLIYFDGNVPEMQNINEDSLRHIFRYLNLMDVVNLAKTCTRFENFTHTDVFPQIAKHIRIDIAARKILLKAPLINSFTSELTLKKMEAAYRFFDQFIEDLTVMLQYVATPNEQAIIWRSSMTMMERSQNLKALHYNSWFLTYEQTDELQDQIEKFEYLKELDISRSIGITNNWRAAKRFSKIEKLNFTARDEISTNFLDYFKNLSSLTIDFRQSNACQTNDLARMFDNNGHCLQSLKLHNLSDLKNYSVVGRLITAKLSKLKSLELGFSLGNNSKYMIELPHLRSLKLSCSHCSINSLLRTLSTKGFIEELSIHDGVFIDDSEKVPPLIFEKLQSLSLHQLCRMSTFWSTMTGSYMPVLHTFDVELRERTDIFDLLKFFESKPTIKSIRLSHKRHNEFIQLGFLKQLVQILQESIPQRPFLNLIIRQFQMDDEEVIKLTCYLLTVKMITNFLYFSSCDS